MVRTSIVVAVLVLSACAKSPAPAPTLPAGQPMDQPAAVAAIAPVPHPAHIPPWDKSKEDIQAFLGKQGITVKAVAPLPPMTELSCAAAKHDQLTLAGDAKVEINRFANTQAATECVAVLEKNQGAAWPKVRDNYGVRGRWLIITPQGYPADQREKLQHAFDSAL